MIHVLMLITILKLPLSIIPVPYMIDEFSKDVFVKIEFCGRAKLNQNGLGTHEVKDGRLLKLPLRLFKNLLLLSLS